MCFITGRTPPATSPSTVAGRGASTSAGSPPKERLPIASRRPGDDDVENRQAVDGDAEIGEIGGDQPRLQPSGAGALLRVGLGDARRARPPADRPAIRRLQALDAAALLVDQHRRIGTADAVAEIGDQVADLRRRLAQLRLKRIRPQRLLGGEEVALLGGQARSGAAGDEGLHGHGAPVSR